MYTTYGSDIHCIVPILALNTLRLLLDLILISGKKQMISDAASHCISKTISAHIIDIGLKFG